MKRANLKMKALSILLTLCMVLQYAPTTAFAAATDNLCEHHTAHSQEVCGYVEGESGCAYHCDSCLGHDHGEEAPVCTCGTDDATIHTTTCAVYVRPENPECFCAEKCEALNQWCDICGFDISECGGTDEVAAYAETVTIYFKNTDGWTTVNAFYWGGTSSVNWPGVAMTHVENDIWAVDVPADALIVFNNGSTLAPDQSIPTDGKNLYTYNTNDWSVYGESSGGGDEGGGTPAPTPTVYPLWVGGVQVTSANLSGEGWTYAPTTNTLTLNNYSYTGDGHNNTALYYRGSDTLNLVLTGENTLNGTDYGVLVHDGLTVTGGSLIASGFNHGVHAEGSITFTDSEVTASGSIGVCTNIDNITFSNSTVNATGTGYGVYANSGNITFSNSTVNATGAGYGVYTIGSININGGETVAEGGNCAFFVAPTIDGAFTNAAVWYGDNEEAANANGAKAIADLAEDYHYMLPYVKVVASEGGEEENAEASVTIGNKITYYETLDEAIQAVQNCTAEDNATVTLLKNVNEVAQLITSGVFTLDLNGRTIDNAEGVLNVMGSGTHVTIADSSADSSGCIRSVGESSTSVYIDAGNSVTITGGNIEGGYIGVDATSGNLYIKGGKITGGYAGVYANGGKVEISGGTVEGEYGVSVNNSTVTITNGTIKGIDGGEGVHVDSGNTVTISGGTVEGEYGVYAYGNADLSGGTTTVTIRGGTIKGSEYGVWATGASTVNINGGTITGFAADFKIDDATVTLGLEDGADTGAAFPDGITVYETTLKAILGEGAAYWKDGQQVTITDVQEEITGGDVTVMTACDHFGNTNNNYTSNGDNTHSLNCSVCGAVAKTQNCSGGTATCTEKAVCTVCAVAYGDTLPHTFGTEWKSNGTNHWHECSCGAKTDEAAHSGGTATCKDKAACSVCTAAYGELANHTYKDGKCTVCEVADPNYKPPATDNPQTGDNSHMALWIALLFISGSAVIALTVYDRKRMV